jgi:hypothetical protein
MIFLLFSPKKHEKDLNTPNATHELGGSGGEYAQFFSLLKNFYNYEENFRESRLEINAVTKLGVKGVENLALPGRRGSQIIPNNI